ncbi:MAG: TonB-dependent receptor [Bacteroidota bacterium]
MNKLVKVIAIFSIISIQYLGYSQQNAKAKLSGIIVDGQSNAVLSFSSIRILSETDNKLIAGNIADEAGKFSVSVPYGSYYAVIEFVGYKAFKTEIFKLSKENSDLNLGQIKVLSSSENLNEVEIRAEKSTMELALDKKVFNVGKDLANAGGTASDILMNIPSVSVDPEGGVKLRGNDNVRILIDGKPSGLVSFKGGAGLQSLQSSMIERVEIITNPSARYEAEGMAGIINIILKKDRSQGFNASIEGVAGNPTNFGLGANMNYRHKKVNFFINYGLTYRISPNVGYLYQEVYDSDTTKISTQDRTGTLEGFNNNIRGGLDYFFNDKNIITASYLFKRSDAHRITDLIYTDYLQSKSNLIRKTFRSQDETEDEPNSEYTLTYKKDFTKKGQNLSAEIKFIDNWERSNQLFTQNAFKGDGSIDAPETILQNSLNDEFEKNWIYQVDYQHPIGKDGKFETGLRSSFRDMVNDYVVNQRNDQGEFIPVPGLKNYFIYNENISAAYGILGNKSKKISYQAGLRAEWTDVKTTLRETNEVNPRKYTNLFPSLHFTYDLPKSNALQLSYSRRVRRPFYNDLSPFSTFTDSRNFFSGNPNLDPEFTNAFEIGHIKYYDKGSLSSSIYFRDTKDKIQTIRLVDNIGFASTRPENLLNEKSYGAEMASQFNMNKWWKMDLSFNFFKADIDGTNLDESYKRETYSWFVRQSSRFTLVKGFDMQLRANYEAAQKTIQGKRLPLYYLDFSTSKEVFKGNGTLNLNILDLFNTRRMRMVTEGDNFFSEGNSQFRRRQVNLTLNYRINQAKNAKKAKSLIEE